MQSRREQCKTSRWDRNLLPSSLKISPKPFRNLYYGQTEHEVCENVLFKVLFCEILKCYYKVYSIQKNVFMLKYRVIKSKFTDVYQNKDIIFWEKLLIWNNDAALKMFPKIWTWNNVLLSQNREIIRNSVEIMGCQNWNNKITCWENDKTLYNLYSKWVWSK